MPDHRLEELESKVAVISQRLDQLERRLSDLTVMPAAAEPLATGAAPDTVVEPLPIEAGSLANLATHLGRVLLIFGGAYLLRAITDLGWVPATGGVLLGAIYALIWLALAAYVGGSEHRRTTAQFYAIAAVLMGMPLTIEAATRFALLSGPQAAVLLLLFAGLALATAWWRNLRALAWSVTLAGILTAGVLLRATFSALPFAVVLLLIGIASFWLAETRNWRGLQWLGGFGASLGVAILTLLVTNENWSISPVLVGVLAVLFLLSYFVSFALRTHVRRHPVGLFEVVHSVLAIGLVAWAVRTSVAVGGLGLAVFGSLSSIAGLAAYALAFTPETRSTRGRNFFYYTFIGLVLIVGGTALLFHAPLPGVIWALLAVMMAMFSGRYGRVTLSLQATLLLLAAGFGSGALALGLQGLMGEPTTKWPTPEVWHFIVAAATVLCLFIPVAQRSERWGRLAGMPQLLALLLAVWQVGGLIVVLVAPAIAHVPGAEADLGLLAVLRTFVLSAAAVTLALSSRHRRWPEAHWLAYPVLAVTGIKLLLEDFPNGRPMTLFLDLAIVGAALIAVAKLLRTAHPESTTE